MPQPSVAAAQQQLTFDNYVQHLKIEDLKTGRLVPLEMNTVQRKIRARIAAGLREQRPVRIIGLKSRRMGFSTIVQASFAHLAFVSERFSVVTGAHEHPASSFLHAMTEQMYDNLPGYLKPQKQIGLRGHHLAFNNTSSLRTFTAGGREGVARSWSARAVHASEVAFWPDAKATLLALRQIVPNAPGTIIILESTANGVGNDFHDEWIRAKSGESGYEWLFFPWYEFEDYRLPVDPSRGLGHLDDEEEALVHLGVTDEQLAWRRYAIADLCGGDIDAFHQEYPATDVEAFLSSGRPYFRGLHNFRPVAPKRVGDFVGDPEPGKRPGKKPITFRPDPQGHVKIWETPKQGTRYAIFADAAGSLTKKVYDRRKHGKKTDAYAALVVDLQTGRHVAQLHGRYADEKVWAWELARLGRTYNRALIAPEKVGGYGVATILYLRDELQYGNIWRETDFDASMPFDEAAQFGWMTTVTTRPQMLAELEAVLREDPDRLRSADLLDEMATFVKNDQGKGEAEVGYHDDIVMCAAGCARIFALRAQPIPKPPDGKRKRTVRSILERAPRIRQGA